MNQTEQHAASALYPDIRVRATRLTKATRIYLGTKDGRPVKPIRADRLAIITARLIQSRITYPEVAALAEGKEVRGATCQTLGMKQEEIRGVLLVQSMNMNYGRRLPDDSNRALDHVFALTQKRLAYISQNHRTQ